MARTAQGSVTEDPVETSTEGNPSTLDIAQAERDGTAHTPETPNRDRVSLRVTGGAQMVNPGTQDVFTSEASKLVHVDAWIEYQLENGRLAIVTDE